MGMHTPPISGKCWYNTKCVAVSEDGLYVPSTMLPLRSTITICSAIIVSYETPDGLMATKPCSRSIALTFPQVNSTRLYCTRAILPWQEKISRIFPTSRVFLRSKGMSTKHGSLSPQASKRLLGGELILKGYDNATISDIVEVTPRTVSNWRKSLNEHDGDICVLARKQGSGQSSRLTAEQKQQLKEAILGGAVAAGYPCERWTSKIVADYIKKKFGVALKPRAVRYLLPTLSLSPQMPVVKSHKYDEAAALKWAKYTWKRLKKSQRTRHHPDSLG